MNLMPHANSGDTDTADKWCSQYFDCWYDSRNVCHLLTPVFIIISPPYPRAHVTSGRVLRRVYMIVRFIVPFSLEYRLNISKFLLSSYSPACDHETKSADVTNQMAMRIVS